MEAIRIEGKSLEDFLRDPQVREVILKSEISAFLHDFGKASVSFVLSKSHPSDTKTPKDEECKRCEHCPLPYQGYRHTEWEKLKSYAQERFQAILTEIFIPLSQLKLPSIYLSQEVSKNLDNDQPGDVQDANLWDMARYHHLKISKAAQWAELQTKTFLVWLIGASLTSCDGLDSKYDKAAEHVQRCDHIYLATPFGFEFLHLDRDRLEKLRSEAGNYLMMCQLNQDVASWRNNILAQAERDVYLHGQGLFRLALGETRRSANDVLLFDHAFSVAAMLKTMLVRVLIESKLCPERYFLPLERPVGNHGRACWRIFSVALNVPHFLYQASRIGEIKGFHEKWDWVCNQIRTELEECLPVGMELYRDLHGIHFLIPSFQLQTPESSQALNTELVDLLHCQVKQSVDQSQYFACHTRVFGNQEDPDRNLLQLARAVAWAHEAFAIPYTSENLPAWIQHEVGADQERCKCCQIHFVDPHKLGYCKHCYELRQGRAERWYKKEQAKTIWMGEIQDAQSQLALVSLKFDLDKWLDGTEIRSLRTGKAQASTKPQADDYTKYPSLARVRRVWSATRIFFNEIQEKLAHWPWGSDNHGVRFQRIRFTATPCQKTNLEAGSGELEVGRQRLSVYFYKTCNGQYEFLSTENLAAFFPDKGPEQILTQVKQALQQPDGFKLYLGNSTDQPGPVHREEACFQLVDPVVEYSSTTYHPWVNIVTTPQLFQFICPADQSDAILHFIYAKYSREMSKVRDRLPLHIRVVYFKHKYPLYVVLKTAQELLSPAYLRSTAPKETWQVCKAPRCTTLTYGPETGQVETRSSTAVELTLQAPQGLQYTWTIDTMTADPQVPDVYYPNFEVQAPEDPAARLPLPPWNHPQTGKPYLNVRALQAGDQVLVQPSTFDCVFADTAEARFLVSGAQRRHPLLLQERCAYYLEDLLTFQRIWQILNQPHYSQSQLQKLQALLLSKQDAWSSQWAQQPSGPEDASLKSLEHAQESPEEVVDHFIHSLLCHPNQLQQYFSKPGTEEDYECLHQACRSGMIFDVIDYYCNLCGRKIKATTNTQKEAKP